LAVSGVRPSRHDQNKELLNAALRPPKVPRAPWINYPWAESVRGYPCLSLLRSIKDESTRAKERQKVAKRPFVGTNHACIRETFATPERPSIRFSPHITGLYANIPTRTQLYLWPHSEKHYVLMTKRSFTGPDALVRNQLNPSPQWWRQEEPATPAAGFNGRTFLPGLTRGHRDITVNK